MVDIKEMRSIQLIDSNSILIHLKPFIKKKHTGVKNENQLFFKMILMWI